MDETIDGGVVQFTDESILDNLMVEGKSDPNNLEEPLIGLSTQVRTIYHSYHGQQPEYKKNEMWIDQVEDVSTELSRFGEPVSVELRGRVIVKSLLSGVPECRMIFKSAIDLLEDRPKMGSMYNLNEIKLHSCVRTARSDNNGLYSIYFVPPDGESQLFSYNTHLNELPLKLLAILHYDEPHSKLDLRLNMKTLFGRYCVAHGLVAKLPLPMEAKEVDVVGLIGTIVHNKLDRVLEWRIDTLPFNSQLSLNCQVKLKEGAKINEFIKLSHIRVICSISGLAASGLSLQSLRIYEKRGYKATKYHRTLTRLTVQQRLQ